MSGLNLCSFPLVPYPGLAPELAVRAGMGGWEPYALAAPATRLLPFVLSRPTTDTSSAWVNCAWLEHADTGARIATLLPTGATGSTPPPSALVLQRVPDPARGLTHFLYTGATVPGLSLPCGVPLRLVLDNAWQSPRFLAYADLSDFLQLEWWHGGPLGGLPYGTGLRQRLYIAGAALAYGATRTEREVSKRVADGSERVDFVALYHTATLSTEPVPAYLSEALDGAAAHAYAEIDGAPWLVKSATGKASGEQGGRASMSLALEQEQVVVRRATDAPPLAAVAYDPTTDGPRGWRCGDTTDTAPEWRTFQRTCLEAADGTNSGYVNESQRDVNPLSSTYQQVRAHQAATPDYTLCPLPVYYASAALTGNAAKNNCPSGYEADGNVVFTLAAGSFTSPVSQAQADADAVAYFTTAAQANANANGTCRAIGTGAQFQPVYDANGCFACLMENVADPADRRDATAAEINQYHVAGVYTGGGYMLCVKCHV